jgi:hypothetical protein
MLDLPTWHFNCRSWSRLTSNSPRNKLGVCRTLRPGKFKFNLLTLNGNCLCKLLQIYTIYKKRGSKGWCMFSFLLGTTQQTKNIISADMHLTQGPSRMEHSININPRVYWILNFWGSCSWWFRQRSVFIPNWARVGDLCPFFQPEQAGILNAALHWFKSHARTSIL